MHKHVVGVWRSKNFTSMSDYLQWYNEKDVSIMHPVIEKMQEKFQNMNQHCRLLFENMSLPNISRTIGYKYSE